MLRWLIFTRVALFSFFVVRRDRLGDVPKIASSNAMRSSSCENVRGLYEREALWAILSSLWGADVGPPDGAACGRGCRWSCSGQVSAVTALVVHQAPVFAVFGQFTDIWGMHRPSILADPC